MLQTKPAFSRRRCCQMTTWSRWCTAAATDACCRLPPPACLPPSTPPPCLPAWSLEAKETPAWMQLPGCLTVQEAQQFVAAAEAVGFQHSTSRGPAYGEVRLPLAALLPGWGG